MDKQIIECTDQLIESIMTSTDYMDYRRSHKALGQFPGVIDQIMELRKQTIELYHTEEEEDILAGTEELGRQYEELQRIPEVNAFLEAEEELVRVLKEVSGKIINSVELQVPG